MSSVQKLTGYNRGNQKGIRNHIVMVSSVGCVNPIVEQVCMQNKDIIPVIHPHGCGHLDRDKERVLATLVGTCNNPNVGGVLVVGLGCETITSDQVFERIHHGSEWNRYADYIDTQTAGDDVFGLCQSKIDELRAKVQTIAPTNIDLSDIVLGLECGGSDIFSGMSANPAVGGVSDIVVQNGGTVILSEVPEMIGAEEILIKRMKNKDTTKVLLDKTQRYIDLAKNEGQDLVGANPTPGNIAGGISTIEEKSLGCILKAGSSPIEGFLEYGESPKQKGLHLMDTPGNDVESMCGMASAGAQVILFTTGRGTPAGHPIAPVIKISSNTKIYDKMKWAIDVDAGKSLSSGDLEISTKSIYDKLLEVMSAKQCKAEKNRCYNFAITRLTETL